ncbi:hypothetical protein [Pedobacter xixiisoli]|uniref:Uncharacterized protein n=1 Tax=Pedobacter xixiisoli TaxID=1476464 RepID=A0A286ACY2_9SPHI|nr:hypothetical protein [Pedobacter xixiisoli]SOD19764.1 hypothetical protein SAMN06297358_3469 [Pedobacter xixiisoli]
MATPSEKLLSSISENFPEEWYKKFNLEEVVEETKEEDYNSFLELIKISKESFFDNINISILTGEYVSADNFQEILNGIKERLANIPQPLPEAAELQEKLQSVLNRNYIECLKVAINMYLDFTVWVSVKLKLSSVDYISHNNEELSDALENEEFDKESYKSLAFVQANLMISRIDHFQTPDIRVYRDLLGYSRDLLKPKKLGGYKFSLLLKEKNDYLLCKWILRKKDISSFPIHHIKNNIEQELDVNDLITNPFKEWIDIIKSHYQFDSEWKQGSYSDFNELKNRSLESLSILQLHRLIKYYKDVSKNLSNLKKIRLEIVRRCEISKDSSNAYDKFVYSILVNYALNNELSLVEENGGYEKLIEHYDFIIDVQATTGIRNFFPQNKVISFLAKSLENKFSEKKVLKDLTELRSIISKCKEIMKDYKRNIKWSERNYNYVFHLPFKECLVKAGNSEIDKIFLASSFVLPLNKTNYINEFDEFNERIGNVESSLKIIENVEDELSSLSKMKEEVITLKKELVDKEMKSMETIAIFTTIVTFVLSSVANFQFIKNAYQASLFVVCLAVSLGFFVFLMLLIRQGDIYEKLRTYIWKILILLGVGTFLWTLLIFSKDIKLLVKSYYINNQKIENKIFKPNLLKNGDVVSKDK